MTAGIGILLDGEMTDGEDMTIHRGTGCLWTDLGYDNPNELRVKSDLAHRVNEILRRRGWAPLAAAEATGLGANLFANADRGQLSKFSVGDLIEALTRLGSDILICVGEDREGEQGVAMVQGPDEE